MLTFARGIHTPLDFTDGFRIAPLTPHHFWVRVRRGAIAFGKGTQIGKEEIFQWTDPNPTIVRCVGFGATGAGVTSVLKIKNVEISFVD